MSKALGDLEKTAKTETSATSIRRRRLNILGARIDESPLAESARRCALFLRQKSLAEGGRLYHVLTVNPEFVMTARRDQEFAAIIEQCDLATPDGSGIILASLILGQRLSGRTTGVALADQLVKLAAEKGYRVFLLGAAPGVAAEAGRIWSRMYPGLHVAGSYPGSPDSAEADEITARITAAQADILFVAFGAPKQDLWIERNRASLPTVRLAMGVGGVFDYLTGRVPFAPAWLRAIGMEWLYRLYKQPWRWKRMLALPVFVLLVVGQKLGIKTNGR